MIRQFGLLIKVKQEFNTKSLGDSVLLLGYSDGAVRVHSLYDLSPDSKAKWRLDNFWELPVHCPDRGAVRSVVHVNSETCGHLVSNLARAQCSVPTTILVNLNHKNFYFACLIKI